MANKNKQSFFDKFSRKPPEVETLRAQIAGLERSVEELTILSDLAFTIGASAEPEEIVETLVDKVMRAVNAEQAVVSLVGTESSDPMKTSLRLVRTSAGHSAFSLSDSLLGWMYLNKTALVLNNPRNDDRFKRVEWDESICTMMCVPLVVKSELTGIITIYNKKHEQGFSESDERLLTIIAARSAQLIENARLRKDSALLTRMQEQAEHAYAIQRNLLPKAPPQIEGYDIAGKSTPAQTVGGDYFDFVPAMTGRLGICLGDVSGKGLPASLLTANLQGTLRGQMLFDVLVDERVRRCNKLMCESTDAETFATLFYGELDSKDHRLSFCSAGHEPALLYSGEGDPARLETTGVALGVVDGPPYGQETVSMEPGDVLVVYSDGITDATNELNDMFGLERLTLVIEKNRDLAATQLIEAIMKAVKAHEGKAEQFDDLTLVVVRRIG
ncbi:MAG: SpoIIE family protein phosphatase [Candidatus Krumholzibacteria bacterium]|nr:SpoIIE family protein phosphatase [Candidatus Krumholzibacteria bacterium]